MEVFTTKLESVLLIKPPTVFEDFRGHYIETYNRNANFTAGVPIDFIQDDISISHRHVLRGLHGDGTTWISCLQGSFYLVVVNNDPNFSQYREWAAFTLLWNDPALNIWWPICDPILSECDQGQH